MKNLTALKAWTTKQLNCLKNFLQTQGIESSPMLTTLASCIFLAGSCIILGLLFLSLTSQILWLGLSFGLATYNLYALTQLIQKLTTNTWNNGLLLKFLVYSNGKLLVSALLILAAIVFTKASIFSLLTGISLPLVVIVVTNLNSTLKKD